MSGIIKPSGNVGLDRSILNLRACVPVLIICRIVTHLCNRFPFKSSLIRHSSLYFRGILVIIHGLNEHRLGNHAESSFVTICDVLYVLPLYSKALFNNIDPAFPVEGICTLLNS